MIEARQADPSTGFRLTAINGLIEELQNRVIRMEEHRNLGPYAEQISQLEDAVVVDRRHRLNDIAELRQDIARLKACADPHLKQRSLGDDIEALRERIDTEEVQTRDILAAIKVLEHLQRSKADIDDTITVAPQQAPCQSLDSGMRRSMAGVISTTRTPRISKCSGPTPSTSASDIMSRHSEVRPTGKRRSLNNSPSSEVGEDKRRRSGRVVKPKKQAFGVVDWTQLT
ncbi:hypothetical protein HII31_07231 [Pseudocercospora fuligena]|uniref:Uncharacterized protein n=1 Tax=Pseudocercospora fuligena TaxID=685502 RepID=A0A8H6RHH7_9PEZI|nr:hypothetical protein HII31_07231 [Pseudocercospora fuligena]